MRNFPEVIYFRITSRCNYNCKYCFGPKNIKELNLDELKKIFKFLHDKRAGSILLTGGEPLIREDIEDILKELKKYNFKIFLDTNGSLFFKNRELIDKYVDVLGLPIDFVDSSYREKNNHDTILKILNHYKNKGEKPIIRIGTVVTQDNFRDLDKIGELLKNYPIDIWKLYEFTPQNINAIQNKSLLEIPVKEFEKVAEKIKNRFSSFFKIVISDRGRRNKAYFLINPNGEVFLPVDDLDVCKENVIGSIFEENIMEKWKETVLKENYIKNIEDTFS